MSEQDAAPDSAGRPTPTPPTPPPPSGRRRAISHGLVAAALATAAFAFARRTPVPPPAPARVAAIPAQPVDAPRPPPTRRPRIELVFALDTTSSMSGLIEGAKRKIWSIASFVASGQPRPDLRIGLVAFRDIGDEYVTRLHDLDDDLDRVYGRLRGLRAEGGGDTPEHVARALDEAVKKISWSQSGDDVMKIVYLVGDAPPHTDYRDGYDFGRAARDAIAAGIAVHTIRCGDDVETERVFRRIASLGKGQFMTVAQDGGMAEVATPYDDELARLHDQLSGSAMAYGVRAASARRVHAAALAAPAPVKLERARFMAATGRAAGGGGDLLDDVKAGVVSLGALAPAELPPELAAVPAAERAAAMAAKSEERARIRRRIDELNRKRDRHLEAARAKSPPARDGFDVAAKRALRESVAARPDLGFEL